MTGSIILDAILVLFAVYIASIIVCCAIVLAVWVMFKVRRGRV